MQTVHLAEPYRPGATGSFGNASMMLIRQFQFPHMFDDRDKKIMAAADRLTQSDSQHTRMCHARHTKTGDMGLELWVKRATDEQVLAFLIDLLKADKTIPWTGYRICGTVNWGTGFLNCTYEVFAKHPQSKTQVFTGNNAPNVLPGPRDK